MTDVGAGLAGAADRACCLRESCLRRLVLEEAGFFWTGVVMPPDEEGVEEVLMHNARKPTGFLGTSTATRLERYPHSTVMTVRTLAQVWEEKV